MDKPLGDIAKIAARVAEIDSAPSPAPLVIPPRHIPPKGVVPPGLVPFTPGHGGKGRFKKTLLDDALNTALARKEKNGKTVAQNLADVMIEKAKKGDTNMAKLIAERTGGLATQRVEEDSTLHIVVERIG